MPDDTIIDKVISFIAGTGDANDDDRMMLLKQLAKDIQQNKYAKFYRPRSEEAEPACAQHFYTVYKTIYPARNFFKDAGVMDKLKNITLESFLDKATMDVIKRLTHEAVEERRPQYKPEDFSKALQEDLNELAVGFDSPKLATADKCYNLMLVFKNFVSWDYMALLRKFDHGIQEGFTTPPKFIPVKADTIMADIASFLSILPSFDPEDDWKTVLAFFKYCRGGADLISLETWNGLLAYLKDLQQSKILELMGRLASGNPIWEVKHTHEAEAHLSSKWLAEKNAEIQEVISGIAEKQKNIKIAALEKAVFENTETTRLTYYNKERGKLLSDKGMEAYVYAPALNHLAAFIQDFINKEMEELADLLLVRGQWTKNSTSIEMSDAYHTIVDTYPTITELDASLSEEGSNGPRLRGALVRVDRDSGQARYVNSIVHTLNEQARNIVRRAVPSFVVVGRHLKMLMEDCQKKPYELIMNWKELALVSKIPMSQRLSDDYKKVNYFVQLMMLEAKVEIE
jgi:hypothetical protein